MSVTLGPRRAECPSCGAPIEWKLGASAALVCGHCRFSVVRRDRDLAALGRVADLVPTAPPLAVGDTGKLAGKPFTVAGRLQLDHGRGPWDEWYVGFADGTWAWLARAQGRWYVTYPREAQGLPPWDALTPGSSGELPGTGTMRWTVSERGGSALISAEGELPFAAAPNASGRYVDLEGEGGAFATIDYNDGSEPAQLFAGRELNAGELALGTKGVGERPEQRVDVARLECPGCGAPIPIFVPGESERCGCLACGALLDHQHGALRLLTQLTPPKLPPFAELGTQGELLGARRTLIGYMQRHVVVDGDTYTWREYLLYSDAGYTWLVEDNWHWVHVAPVPASAVKRTNDSAYYRGRNYRRFAKGEPVVELVAGEFYWKVQAGDRAKTVDYIAPPRILSLEESEGEINWSEGEYVEPAVVWKAFGVKGSPPTPVGVAPAQPNPFKVTGAVIVFALLTALWLMIAVTYDLSEGRVVADATLDMPPSERDIKNGAARPPATFLPELVITKAPTAIELELESSLDNGWVAVDTALLEQDTGDLSQLGLMAEHYHGVTDGESWSEGDTSDHQYYGPLDKGRYVLRVEPSWDGWPENFPSPAPPTVRLRVTEGKRNPICCFGAFVLLLAPLGLRVVRKSAFEQRRKENENL